MSAQELAAAIDRIRRAWSETDGPMAPGKYKTVDGYSYPDDLTTVLMMAERLSAENTRQAATIVTYRPIVEAVAESDATMYRAETHEWVCCNCNAFTADELEVQHKPDCLVTQSRALLAKLGSE